MIDDTIKKVRDFLRLHAMISGSRGIVAAVSGGPDSMALLNLLFTILKDREDGSENLPVLHVAHLDHRLRGAQSAEEAEFVRQTCSRMGIDATIGSADVARAASESGRGIEETAREIRYNFLLQVARDRGCDRIATGHNMNDQAETFLMRLARGAGLSGLASMRPVTEAHVFSQEGREIGQRPLLIRPLLCLTRPEIESYLESRSIEFRTDPSNLTMEYARNRVRHQVIPALMDINSRAVEHIYQAVTIIAEEDRASAGMAVEALGRARMVLPDSRSPGYGASSFLEQSPVIRKRMIYEAIRQASSASFEAGSEHIAAVESLLGEGMSGKHVELPGGLEAWREFDALVFRRAAGSETQEQELAGEGAVRTGGVRIEVMRRRPGSSLQDELESARVERIRRGRNWMIALLDEDMVPWRLAVRPRRRGERAEVSGQTGIKKLKNLMIDNRIPVSRRSTWPVLSTVEGEYVWSPGLPPARRYAASPESRALVILRALVDETTHIPDLPV